MSRTPVLSFVATSRNDDHGGDVLRRTQTFINRLAEQCNRHQVSAELVLVDWNPPPSRAPLADVLAWPAGTEWFSARVITVPPALHREFAFSKRLAMFQMIAKNVGIRRAYGDYMIATNIDIVFSDALFGWLKSAAMRPGVLYRSDRWDIPNEIQSETSLDRLLSRAKEEHIRRNLVDGTYVRRDGGFVNTYGVQIDHSMIFPIRALLYKLQESIKEQAAFDRDAAVEAIGAILETDLPQLRRNFLVPALHTNGCGDFTMMARQDWSALRGYPEWHVFSWNIDSMIVFQAHYNDLGVEVLAPDCVHYHVEHDYGSGWTPEGADSLWSRLAELGLPFIDYQRFYELIYELQDRAAEQRSARYNDSDWGLDGIALDCTVTAAQGSPPRPAKATNHGKLDEGFLQQLIPVSPGIALEHGQPTVEGVRIERRATEAGQIELAVVTLPDTWSYAFYYDLRPLALPSGEYWIKLQLVVEEGNVTIGVLNRDGSQFLSQVSCRGARHQVQQLFSHIGEIDDASQVILRNTTPDNKPAQFRLRGIELLREDTADEDILLARPEIILKRRAGLTLALRDNPAASPDRHAPALPSPPRPLDLSALRPSGPEAIVRLLGSASPEVGDAAEAVQALIITPAAANVDAAVLELDPPGNGADTLRVQLQVLEGETTISVDCANRQKPAARTLPVCPPFTRIDLAIGSAGGRNRLVIGNGALGGRSKVLLHAVDYANVRSSLAPPVLHENFSGQRSI